MTELHPYPFAALLRRMLQELSTEQSIFGLSAKKFFLGDPDRDLSVRFHGRTASSPLGPAAGPHTQMAQNIVLSWLVGGRIMELKTVQILDELDIPRPCIDMQTIGFNVEWSQELKLEQSLDEYVKASMLIDILVACGKLELAPGFDRVIYDMSVGYDLAGIQTPRVRAFMAGMMDAGAVVERLRAEIPDDLAWARDVAYNTKLSGSLTLSTFHGCPPDEIEKIIDFLLREVGLDCVIKLNPMLLGPEEARRLLGGVLGYEDVHIPDSAFTRDIGWDHALAIVGRLRETAASLGLGLGVKFSNTLIVENHRAFFPESEKEMYLSGPPLHVLAMSLVRRFRRVHGDAVPISFSAGIDRKNFPDAVAIGLVPVTVCSDLLKPGGYGRAQGYLQDLSKRMAALGASNIDEYIVRAYGLGEEGLGTVDPAPTADERDACLAALASGGDLRAAAGEELFPRWVSATKLLNTERYVGEVVEDQRYGHARNAKPPRRLESHLALFDCVTCDKCIPVCPNHANFAYDVPQTEIPVTKLRRQDGAWVAHDEAPIALSQKHQIGNFAEFCNECGNCDVFCPELDGPYRMKPRFFAHREAFEAEGRDNGFLIERSGGVVRVAGRFAAGELRMEARDGRVAYSGPGFSVTFDPSDPRGTIEGEAGDEVDLTFYYIMDVLRSAVLEAGVNYVSALQS